MKDGILVPWQVEIHRAVRHNIPLMAVIQQKSGNEKVRPVLDFRQLNGTIESRPAGATPICQDRLREWRLNGGQCALIDLRKAYLQIQWIRVCGVSKPFNGREKRTCLRG